MMQQVTDSQIDPDEKFNKSEGGKGEVAVKYLQSRFESGQEENVCLEAVLVSNLGKSN